MLSKRLEEIDSKLNLILGELKTMSTNLSANFLALQAEVQNAQTVEASAVTLIQGLAAQIEAAIAANQNGDTAALPNLLASLKSSDSALAAAVQANTTPPAPAPTPTAAAAPLPSTRVTPEQVAAAAPAATTGAAPATGS